MKNNYESKTSPVARSTVGFGAAAAGGCCWLLCLVVFVGFDSHAENTNRWVSKQFVEGRGSFIFFAVWKDRTALVWGTEAQKPLKYITAAWMWYEAACWWKLPFILTELFVVFGFFFMLGVAVCGYFRPSDQSCDIEFSIDGSRFSQKNHNFTLLWA